MRLHNRMVKANFWTDTDLIKNLSRDGRMFYQGLWQLADDSGCIEDDVLAFKIHLFPADEDITPQVLTDYRDKLVEMNKLTPYVAEGKSCLYINNFHKHQSIKNPAPPSVPLPAWLKWIPYPSNPRSGRYQIVSKPSETQQEEDNLQSSYDVLTDNLQSSSNHNHNQKVQPEVQAEPEGRGCGGTSESKETREQEFNDHPLNDHQDKNNFTKTKEVPNTTTEEREILSVLRSVEGYPFDFSKDLQFIRDLAVDYPALDLLYQVKKWRDYKRDKPLTKKSSPRSQLRNWMNKANEWRVINGGEARKRDPTADEAIGRKGKYAHLYKPG